MQKDLTTDEVQEALQKLMQFLEDAKKQWDIENPNPKSWLGLNRGVMYKATMFLTDTTDNLIQYVETLLTAGPEKKAAVLMIMGQLFDYVLASFAPVWLKPLVPIVKQIVVSIIIGNLIDFIVQKYRSGYWKMEQAPESGAQNG